MILNWFFSKTVREAVAMRKHVWKLLSAQRDILSPQAIGAVTLAMNELQAAISESANKGRIRIKMEELEFAANKWLKPYPHPAWRENVEVLLVALAVAMGIRTFFAQPFKIPTGSMQPTLWGVTSDPDFSQTGPPPPGKRLPAFQVPTGLARLRDWFDGASYVELKAKTDGALEEIAPPTRFLIFNINQRLRIGDVWHTIWFPPDYGGRTLQERAGLRLGEVFHRGDDVVKMRVTSGDHLFVDRLTYNFRRPRRGEIIVFETKGIHDPLNRVPPDQFYIKRLVALGDEKVQIGSDHHLIINGARLDASTPGFGGVYSFKMNAGENQYFGHLQLGMFRDDNSEYTVPPENVLVMGDNTRNSLDSRFFGGFAEKYVIGKSWFVYWPISSRFGWGYE